MNRGVPDDPSYRPVGRVVRPHGLRGEVVVEVRTDLPERRFARGSVLRGDHRVELTVTAAREHRGRWLVRFEGIEDRAAAESLRDTVLAVPVETLETTEDPDEFHDHQLEGLTAIGRDGALLGTVREVMHAPGNDVLVLGGERGELLVPFVRAIVPEVDLGKGRVVVDPPDGLLDG